MNNNSIELRIVGPQFSDTGFFVVWLHNKYSAPYQYIELEESDSAYEFNISRESRRPIHALLSRAPYLNANNAYRDLLKDAEMVLIILCRAQKFNWLNIEELNSIMPRIPQKAKVIVAANDSLCDRDESKLISLDEIKKLLPANWPIISTAIGSFEKPNSSFEGAEEVFSYLMEENRDTSKPRCQ